MRLKTGFFMLMLVIVILFTTGCGTRTVNPPLVNDTETTESVNTTDAPDVETETDTSEAPIPDTTPSNELAYTVNPDGKGYSVTGIGTYTGKKIDIPSVYNGKPVTAIGDRAFYGCTELTGVTFPSSVTVIGEYAFYGCIGLTEIMLPSRIATIHGYAFANCSGIRSVTIPGTTPYCYISKGAFSNCAKLMDFNFTGTMAKWASNITLELGWDEKLNDYAIICTDGSFINS